MKEDRAYQGASPSSSPPEPGHTYHIGPSFSDHSYRSSELLAEMFISGTKLIRRRMLAEISMRKISCSGLTLLTVWHSGRLLMTSTWSSSFLKPRKGEIFHWYHEKHFERFRNCAGKFVRFLHNDIAKRGSGRAHEKNWKGNFFPKWFLWRHCVVYKTSILS